MQLGIINPAQLEVIIYKLKIYEYQAKRLVQDYGLPVPKGKVASNVEETVAIFQEFGGNPCAIKAQILAGGRGKAGGIKIVRTEEEAKNAAEAILGGLLVTNQTDQKGVHIKKVLVEEAVSVSKELYLAIIIDNSEASPILMACSEGGVEIEEIAARTPEKIIKEKIDPFLGMHGFQVRRVADKLGLNRMSQKEAISLFEALFAVFKENDCTLMEINPLALTAEGDICALDLKMDIDENALYRRPDLVSMKEFDSPDSLEAKAFKYELSYIGMDGDIGCMVNGAGLAMATMDIIKLHGGEPANFLDVGGDAPVEKVKQAFELILADQKVKAILVNIFGGIMRCDVIADGIIQAVEEVNILVPLVVRLDGTNVDIAKEILKNSGLNIISVEDMNDAANRIVRLVR